MELTDEELEGVAGGRVNRFAKEEVQTKKPEK